MKRTLAPPETWPDLRIIIRLLPWTWRVKPAFYVDDHPAGFVTFRWLFLEIEWFAQDKPEDWFTEPKTAPQAP